MRRAGGVGSAAVPMGQALGATVIATVGDEEKAKIARAAGAEHTILYRSEDFVARGARDHQGQALRRRL